MSELSRIGDVADRLVDLTSEATGLQVVDGPLIGEIARDVVMVGVPDGDNAAYETTITRQQGMGRPRLVEEFSIICVMILRSGTNDVRALRSAAISHLQAVDAALRADVRAESVWDRVTFGSQMQWVPAQTPQGAVCTVLYKVEGASLL